MTQGLTSACFCGAVRLELTGAPNVQAYCHCGSCRGWLGAPIHGATLWPTPNVAGAILEADGHFAGLSFLRADVYLALGLSTEIARASV